MKKYTYTQEQINEIVYALNNLETKGIAQANLLARAGQVLDGAEVTEISEDNAEK